MIILVESWKKTSGKHAVEDVLCLFSPVNQRRVLRSWICNPGFQFHEGSSPLTGVHHHGNLY